MRPRANKKRGSNDPLYVGIAKTDLSAGKSHRRLCRKRKVIFACSAAVAVLAEPAAVAAACSADFDSAFAACFPLFIFLSIYDRIYKTRYPSILLPSCIGLSAETKISMRLHGYF